MSATRYHFAGFTLDGDERTLARAGELLELNARYFDALALLLREHGRLITKDRFLAEVWRGVPVTDEALTQCIRSLRRLLGDDAAQPRFIETVPKFGYRFIAPLSDEDAGSISKHDRGRPDWRLVLITTAAGTLGAWVAGAFGGLGYGLMVSGPAAAGAASTVMVLLCAAILVALLGGCGVAGGIALATLLPEPYWRIVGGALGGAFVGALAKLLGLDAFAILLGQSPGDITGAGEGLILGAAAGLAAWSADRGANRPVEVRLVLAGASGAVGGLIVALTGGRLFAGSLALLVQRMPRSHLELDRLGALFGETGFGPRTATLTAAVEGALFVAGIVGGMLIARRTRAD